MTHSKTTIKALLILVFTVISWGSAYVGIRLGLQGGYSPGGLALLRFCFASLGILPLFLRYTNRRLPKRKDWWMLILMGVVGVGVYNMALNYGEMTVHAGTASFILSQIPVGLMLLAPWCLREKNKPQAWLGVMVSMVGVGIISFARHDGAIGFEYGIIYLLVAVLCGAIYGILSKKLALDYQPLALTAFAMWGGAISLCVYIPQLLHDVHVATWTGTLSVLYLGIVPAVLGYWGWGYAVCFMSVSSAASFLYLMPLVATLLGWLILGEASSPLVLLGGLLALVGAIVVNRSNANSQSISLSK